MNRKNRTHKAEPKLKTNASLDVQQWQSEHIKAAIQQADAGRLIEHEELKRMVKRWRQERDTRA